MKQRDSAIDIMKGILIIWVVMGHALLEIPYIDGHWCRMPAFFLISGYLCKSFLLTNNDLHKKVCRLVVPYFAYSILFFLLLHPEGLLKNMLRTIYAGAYNITMYAFPWWFINALFVSLIGLSVISKITNKFTPPLPNKYKWVLVFILLWGITEMQPLWKARIIPLPWSIDNAFGAMSFMLIGYYFRNLMGGINYNGKIYYNLLVLCVIMVVSLIMVQSSTSFHYIINMKSMTFEHPILDLVIPLSFAYIIYCLSWLMSKVWGVNEVFSFIGTCSMTIFYVHAAVLYLGEILGFNNMVARVILAVIIGCLVDYMARKNKYTRTLFLGTGESFNRFSK